MSSDREDSKAQTRAEQGVDVIGKAILAYRDRKREVEAVSSLMKGYIRSQKAAA